MSDNSSSLEKALNDIKQTISSDNSPQDDILELTEVVEDDIMTKISDKIEEEPSQLLDKKIAEETKNLLAKHLHKEKPKPKIVSKTEDDDYMEHFVGNLIKPYLKEWLDKNLQGIVKKIVESEVKKIMPKE